MVSQLANHINWLHFYYTKDASKLTPAVGGAENMKRLAAVVVSQFSLVYSTKITQWKSVYNSNYFIKITRLITINQLLVHGWFMNHCCTSAYMCCTPATLFWTLSLIREHVLLIRAPGKGLPSSETGCFLFYFGRSLLQTWTQNALQFFQKCQNRSLKKTLRWRSKRRKCRENAIPGRAN